MLPSTISYRLQYMERMQRLLHTLPKLSKKTSPVTLTYLGLHPKIKAAAHNTQTTTYDIYRKFQPTHVVHLTAVEGDVLYSSSDVHGISPYGDQPPLHQVRQCSVAMEQCLTSVARAKRRPMLVYATSLSDNPKLVDSNGSIQHTMGMMDEVMASVYGRVEGVKTIGLRLGRVYGPWMRPNDVMYDMARRAVRGDPILVDGSDDDTAGMDMVYVEDVVEALITAMQMSPPDSTGDDDKNSGVIHMDTVAPSTTMPHIAALMQDALTTNNNNNEEDESGPMTSSLHYTNGKLHYTPHTPLTAGIIKTLAWHTRQEYPYSTPPYPNMASLASGGYDTLPCASECVPEGSNRCSPSTLDNVVVLSREYSRGCNVVMYTLVLGGDEVRLPLPTSKSPQFVYDEQGGEMVCKFAYVNQGSGLGENSKCFFYMFFVFFSFRLFPMLCHCKSNHSKGYGTPRRQERPTIPPKSSRGQPGGRQILFKFKKPRPMCGPPSIQYHIFPQTLQMQWRRQSAMVPRSKQQDQECIG